MPKDRYYPDTREPHIHEHKGGITFTDVGHNHRTLVNGDQVRERVAKEVVEDLLQNGDPRSRDIAKWIEENIL